MQYFIDNWSTKQLIVSTTLFLFWSRKIVPNMFVIKTENNSMLEKVLLVYNRNGELLRLVGTKPAGLQVRSVLHYGNYKYENKNISLCNTVNCIDKSDLNLE